MPTDAINVVLITALATVGAVIYNLVTTWPAHQGHPGGDRLTSGHSWAAPAGGRRGVQVQPRAGVAAGGDVGRWEPRVKVAPVSVHQFGLVVVAAERPDLDHDGAGGCSGSVAGPAGAQHARATCPTDTETSLDALQFVDLSAGILLVQIGVRERAVPVRPAITHMTAVAVAGQMDDLEAIVDGAGSRAGYTTTPESVSTTTRPSPRVALRASPLTRGALNRTRSAPGTGRPSNSDRP